MAIIQIFIIIFALFAISRAFLRFKDNKLSKNEFLFWVLVWLVVIIIGINPNITGIVSNVLGIGRGIDLLVYGGIILLFYLIFRLYVKVDAVEKDITTVVRKLAIDKDNKNKKKR